MNNHFTIRMATVDDAEQILKVYAPYVLETANTFEYDVPGVEEFKTRIETISAQYPYLVCEHNGEIVGYVYGSTHRYRTAYQWSVESTVYISAKFHRMGIGRIMYEALFAMLRLQGYYSVYAGVLSSNTGSVALHKACGFREIGLFHNIGYKHGAWHTNNWMEYFLQEHVVNPSMPLKVGNVVGAGEFAKVLRGANENASSISSQEGGL